MKHFDLTISISEENLVILQEIKELEGKFPARSYEIMTILRKGGLITYDLEKGCWLLTDIGEFIYWRNK